VRQKGEEEEMLYTVGLLRPRQANNVMV